MSLEQAILDAVRALLAGKQQEILSHAARLRDESAKKRPFKSVKGLWADLGISLSSDDIEQNQKDMEELPQGRLLMPAVVLDTHSIVWYLSADRGYRQPQPMLLT